MMKMVWSSKAVVEKLVQLLEDRGDQFAGRVLAVRAHHLRQAAAAEFVAGGVQVVGDAVGIEHQGVARAAPGR